MIHTKDLIKLKSFTLTELLVVLCIIGILVLLALPNLLPLITKAKSLEAKLQLEHIHTLETTYYYTNSKYTNDLNELGFIQDKLITNNGNANYIITISSSSPSNFVAKAVSVSDFDQDGQFNTWTINEKKDLKESIPD